MDAGSCLFELRKMARKDPEIRQRLLDSRREKDPVTAFCRVSRDLGYEIYPMDLVCAGEEMIAQMKRSINGGGENHPDLLGEDDYYEQFMKDLETMEQPAAGGRRW